MNKFEFTIIASGLDHTSPSFEDNFYEAGCDDATISFSKGRIIIEFHREAKNFIKAICSAIKDVQKTGARIEHFEPDYLVSLSDIAERANLSRAAISNYKKGIRHANFPAPSHRVTTDSPLWEWLTVARWMHQNTEAVDLETVTIAKIIHELNEMVVEKDQQPKSRFSAVLEKAADFKPKLSLSDQRELVSA